MVKRTSEITLGKENTMRRLLQSAGLLSVAALAAGAVAVAPAAAQKRGGVLEFVVGSKIPSFDGHTETTFGMCTPHPAVLQPADPGQSGQSGLANGFHVRFVRRQGAGADRRRHDLHFQNPQGREVP